MDTILEAFLSWQFLFFCIAIGAVVFVIRQVAEYAMANWRSKAKESKLWRDLALPILPIVLGQVAALLIKQYPYPEGFSSTGGRLVFGLVAGFSSGLVVRLYRSFLSSKVAEYGTKIRDARRPKNNVEPEDPGASVRDSINKG
jgi:hypothetical protein